MTIGANGLLLSERKRMRVDGAFYPTTFECAAVLYTIYLFNCSCNAVLKADGLTQDAVDVGYFISSLAPFAGLEKTHLAVYFLVRSHTPHTNILI